jgi:cell division protein FtsB
MNADVYGKINPYVKDLLSVLFATVSGLQYSVAETKELSATVAALQVSIAEQQGDLKYNRAVTSSLAALRDSSSSGRGPNDIKALLATVAALKDAIAEQKDDLNSTKASLRKLEQESFSQASSRRSRLDSDSSEETRRNERGYSNRGGVPWNEKWRDDAQEEPSSFHEDEMDESRSETEESNDRDTNPEGDHAVNSVALGDKKYPRDCFSFLSLHAPWGTSKKIYFFLFGLLPFIFQMMFLILLLWSGTDELRGTVGENDNPDSGIIASFISANVSRIVRCAQVLAIAAYLIFSDSSIKDVVRAVQHFPRRSQVQPGDAVGCIGFSCLLRGVQGILAAFTLLLLVITSDNVVDIILNFAAVSFISNLNAAAFLLALSGEFGPILKEEAGRILNKDLPSCMYKASKHIYHSIVVGIISVLFSAMLISLFVAQESNNLWLTRTMRVQFQEGTGLKEYSGCYEINDKSSFFQRHTYNSLDLGISTASSFGYCRENRQWILFEGNEDYFDPCSASKNDLELARSSKTDAFDISTSFDELWVSSSNTPLDLYFFGGRDRIELHCDLSMGDGFCDQEFNTLDFNYDGGDCCAATCTQSNCGIGGLASVFGSSEFTEVAFPYCVNPEMLPITIRLDAISTSQNVELSQFQDEGIDQKELWRQAPVAPYFSLDCNGRNVLTVYIQEIMVSNSETVMVEDGANCELVVRNTTANIFAIDDPIWFVNYTLFHGDENKSVKILTQNSKDKETANFVRIPECYFRKLENHVDVESIYTATGPSNQAIRWLLKDRTGHSDCEDDNFIERYALVNIVFAMDGNETLINEDDQCRWPSIACREGQVKAIKLRNEDLKGGLPTEIALLQSLEEIYLGEWSNTMRFASSCCHMP